MKKTTLLTVIAVLIFASGYSQASLWTPTNEGRLLAAEKLERTSTPKNFQLFSLDLAGLKNQLQSAPSRETANGVSSVILSFPNPSGKMMKYQMFEASVMDPELAAKHPEIQSYVGKGIDDPTASIHITTTIFGLHTMTLSGNGTFYIDPYTKDLKNYIVYSRKGLTTRNEFSCGYVGSEIETAGKSSGNSFENAIMASDSKFRTYRLAMACTIEYAAVHIAAAGVSNGTEAQKKAAVLAAMNVTVARVNSVYERDMSLKMQIIANNTNIIYVTSDSFDNSNTNNALLQQSQQVIPSIIGNANFDIGHTVSTGGGGVALKGQVCVNTTKAGGITGSPSPVGDPFDIDYVAHEMGHQFGADHTFAETNNGGNCTTGTVANTSAMEPGSGTTIMAYAGICVNNVQPNSDDYFHIRSLQQMNTIVNSGCVAGVANSNTPPAVSALTSYTIPVGTPFALTGSATDANNDTLTYCWEQTNAGAQAQLQTGAMAGPNFRSFDPTTSPKRYFPSLSLLAGGGTSPYEVLPTIAKTLQFSLTVRDNRSPNGGQTGTQTCSITTNTTGGAFSVTSQNADNITWVPGQTESITWNAGNTASAPFNAPNVKITMSLDNGITFPVVLAASTPNDGQHTITVPSDISPTCRIMVEAIGNVFFSVNSKTFSNGYIVTTVCNTYTNNTPTAIADGSGTNSVVFGAIGQSTINVPDTGNLSDVNVTLNITHTYMQDLLFNVYHPDATEVSLFQFPCGNVDNMSATFSDNAPALVCGSPITGNINPATPLSAFNEKPANGEYTLLFGDGFSGDTGTLNSWSIEVCSQTFVPLTTETFSLQDFKIYPNPNKGKFNIEFNSSSSNEIKVGVYDLSGRLILDKTYPNSGKFSESLQLNSIQAGVYMVTVQDGKIKETKRIIVE